jgi:hypothetical protein
MGKSTSYSSPKSAWDTNKSTSYESTKSSKTSSYDSSKTTSYESKTSSKVNNELNRIKELINDYFEICQKIEDAEFSLVELKTKRDVIRDRILACPNADKFFEMMGLTQDPKKTTKR